MSKKKQEVKDFIIDADHILHLVASDNPKDHLEGETLDAHIDLDILKRKFEGIVMDYENVVATEVLCEDFKLGKTILIFSDPKKNFRFKVLKTYKHKRPKKSADFYALRKWAHKKYGIIKGAEADDAVAYYVYKGAVGLSTDKDLIKGVSGWWYDAYYQRKLFGYTTVQEALRFSVLQSVMGDPGDDIPGIFNVGEAKAEKALAGDYSWESVVRVYKQYGETEKEALITKRLVSLEQWTPKKGVRLWQPKNK